MALGVVACESVAVAYFNALGTSMVVLNHSATGHYGQPGVTVVSLITRQLRNIKRR